LYTDGIYFVNDLLYNSIIDNESEEIPMKKLFVMLLAVMLLLSGLTVFAEEDTFAMPHDTAIVFVDGVQYDLVLDNAADTGKGYLTAVYTSSNGEMLSIAVSDTAGENYYAAGPGAADMGTFIFYFSDGSKIFCSASEYGHERGYPCEMAVTAFDRDGWYQVLGMGTAMNKDTGDTYEFTAGADFILNGGTVPAVAAATAAPVEEEPAGDSGTEPFDMPHGTAVLFIDGVEHDFTIVTVEDSGKGYINAIFSNDDGEMFGAAISDSVTDNYYAAGEGARDMGTFMYIASDGTKLVSSCSDYGYTNGYPCEMGFTVYDDNGWYQVVGAGTAMNKETGETYKLTTCVDFVWDEASAAE